MLKTINGDKDSVYYIEPIYEFYTCIQDNRTLPPLNAEAGL